ncbi:prolyl 3-hydroxylase OGFOD1-like [Saccoglossus kowalevskii]
MTCAKYEYTDVLLCHDDELEGRRIAFILYLVPHWDIKDGGNLDLFETDEHGQPSEIVKSLVPSWNTLSFFEVTPVSFHQVSEVLTQDKTRLSVSGWFHGPPIDRPAPFIEPLHVLQPAVTFQNDKLGDWLNPMYIDMLIQSQIQEKFSEDSEIELQNFLKEEKYEAVLSAVKESAIKWVRKGPANKRNYEMASDTSLPGILKECIEVLKSEEMFLLLSNFTGLRLHELAPDSDSEDDMRGDDSESVKAKEETKKKEINPRCRSEVRRWRHGSYTLLHDTDTEGAEYALDCMLFLNCNGKAVLQVISCKWVCCIQL